MATYRCLADLQGKTLKLSDIVYLKGIQYSVREKYLREELTRNNNKIFDVLSISSKEDFASDAYNYKSTLGAWPECKYGDYEALTRLVIKLYKIIESSIITGFKIKGLYIKQLDSKEVVKLLKGYNVCFDESKWAFDSTGWYYWNTQDFKLQYTVMPSKLGSSYQDITPSDNPNQWYKITAPGESGISPEQVKELIVKYGGLINSSFNYKSRSAVYTWTKNTQVECISQRDVAKDAIEVSPTTEIIITKKEEKYENQFQRKKACVKRGTRPEGSTVCGRRGKTSVAVGHLGYRKVTGI